MPAAARAGSPAVPADQWRHDTGWVDDFPSRATFVSSYTARNQGLTCRAACALPGDFAAPDAVELSEPPAPDDDAAIREQCAYLGHIDFGAWTVGAADTAGGVTAAALVSPGGYVARCVLSADAGQREVQLSATPVGDVSDGGVFFRSGGRDPFVLVGAAGTVGC